MFKYLKVEPLDLKSTFDLTNISFSDYDLAERIIYDMQIDMETALKKYFRGAKFLESMVKKHSFVSLDETNSFIDCFIQSLKMKHPAHQMYYGSDNSQNLLQHSFLDTFGTTHSFAESTPIFWPKINKGNYRVKKEFQIGKTLNIYIKSNWIKKCIDTKITLYGIELGINTYVATYIRKIS